MEVSNNNSSDHQIYESPYSTIDVPELQQHRSSNSIFRERQSNSNLESYANNATSIQQQTNTNTTTTTTNSSQQNEQQQRQQHVMYCDCGFESVLREVKKDNVNRGRYFWSCSKFGGPDHARRCNFFRWDTSNNDDDNDAMAESSSSAQNRFNRPEMPYVLIESANINIDNESSSDEEDEVNTHPGPDQLSENEETRASTITTPPTTPHRRTRNSTGRTSSSQHLSQLERNGTDTTIVEITDNTRTTNATRSLSGNVFTRAPAVFGNWDNVPKFSTPQLLDIVQNHLVKQDKNYQKWFTATHSAKKDLEEAKKEVEKLKRDLDVMNRENKLNKRETEVLKAEKRLLQHENDVLKEENRELKRRRQ